MYIASNYYKIITTSLLSIIAMLVHIPLQLLQYYQLITISALFITASLISTDYYLIIMHYYYPICHNYYSITTQLLPNYCNWMFNDYMDQFQFHYFMITPIATGPGPGRPASCENEELCFRQFLIWR